MPMSPAVQRELAALSEKIAAQFSTSDWLKLGAITGCLNDVQGHSRLLRSLSFGDEDYAGNVLMMLITMVGRDPANLEAIRYFVSQMVETTEGVTISTVQSASKRIYFSPSVFQTPTESVNDNLVSVMMPFSLEFEVVFDAIKSGANAVGFDCQRAKDIWQNSTVIQDIFSLIFRSSIVVCDFSGRNPNVFYEAGIAHTLGKHVVPITQADSDIPFDLRHHRYQKYLNNSEGLRELTRNLEARLRTLRSKIFTL